MTSKGPAYYLNVLYPVQDDVLSVVSKLATGIYLSGGTAVSRGYLHHRFSEDLDLFADDSPDFALWSSRLIQALQQDARWSVSVVQREERLIRLGLDCPQAVLKIEIINDVPGRVGAPAAHPTLGLLDCPENLLANKVTALLDRSEPKDLADIWGLCSALGLSLSSAIEGAQGKAAGVFAPDLARRLLAASDSDWTAVLWQDGPDQRTFLKDLYALGEALLRL